MTDEQLIALFKTCSKIVSERTLAILALNNRGEEDTDRLFKQLVHEHAAQGGREILAAVDSMSPDREAILSFLGWLQVRDGGEFRIFYKDHLGYFWPAKDYALDALVDEYLKEGT